MVFPLLLSHVVSGLPVDPAYRCTGLYVAPVLLLTSHSSMQANFSKMEKRGRGLFNLRELMVLSCQGSGVAVLPDGAPWGSAFLGVGFCISQLHSLFKVCSKDCQRQLLAWPLRKDDIQQSRMECTPIHARSS
eukprot:1157566-Pelagomonas_calceolata.AAC.11